jgi:plastocyanin
LTAEGPHQAIGRPRSPGPIPFVALGWALLGAACGKAPPPPAENHPDDVLRAELGLTDQDEVHRVTLTGGRVEVLDPVETSVPAGAWVEFVSTDDRIHEIRFEVDSLAPESRAFLEGTDQVSSPPLVDRGARFVVSFRDAPEGRYPFRAEGNKEPGHGVVVVVPKR